MPGGRGAIVMGLALGLALLPPPAGPGAARVQPPARIAPAVDSVAQAITEASLRFGLPAAWIHAVIRLESHGDPQAVSSAGALGLMQVMPRTFAALRAPLGLGADPFDVRDNILAGAGYLRRLYDRYGSPGFLAAYNAGPARWEDHLATARPLPRETLDYLARLAPVVDPGRGDRRLAHAPAAPGSPLFAPLDGAFTTPRNAAGSPGLGAATALANTAEPSGARALAAHRTDDDAPRQSALFAPTGLSGRAP